MGPEVDGLRLAIVHVYTLEDLVSRLNTQEIRYDAEGRSTPFIRFNGVIYLAQYELQLKHIPEIHKKKKQIPEEDIKYSHVPFFTYHGELGISITSNVPFHSGFDVGFMHEEIGGGLRLHITEPWKIDCYDIAKLKGFFLEYPEGPFIKAPLFGLNTHGMPAQAMIQIREKSR